MDNILKKLVKNNLYLFLIVLAFATAFYLFRIGFSDLWSDEIYTKSMLGGSLTDFFAKFKNDLHPPLYYLGLRLFTGLFGINAVSLRLFSVLGVLSTILLGYFAGQRVFGKQGALIFCLMLISVPMLAAYSHQARMYTWAAFTVSGVFLYSYLLMRTGKYRDLVLLLVFTVLAMYTHYYSLAAAFVANMFVFLHLLLTKNKKWLPHLLSLVLAIIFFLPWLPMFIIQVNKVQHAFWAPEVSLKAVLSCFTIPFTEQFWTTGYSISLTVLIYALFVFAFFKSFTQSYSEYRLVLWLSIFIFIGTIFAVSIISLISQSILSTRYVMAIAIMLVIPPAVLLIQMEMKWLKIILTSVILFLGIRISVSNFHFSYGPYKQTIEYISATYPEIKKILHITEITAGPMVEYTGKSGLSHYWLKAKMSNVDAFPEVHQYIKPGEFLEPGEVFCTVRFQDLELNKENLDLVLSESELVKTDTVRDNKLKDGIIIQVYMLKYKGR